MIKRITNIIALLVICFAVFGTGRARADMPIYYYDYFTMSMGDANVAVLNPDPRVNALFLHNPAGLSYIQKRGKRQLIRFPLQIIMRYVHPQRRSVYDWGERILRTWWDEARLIYAANTGEFDYIGSMTQEELMSNLLNPSPEFEDTMTYQVYYDELGYLVDGYIDLYSGQKTLPEIYKDNKRFKEYMEKQHEGTSYVQSSFQNWELVGRADTRSTFGVLGRMVDNFLGMDDVFGNFLSWDVGITGFLHPRVDSLLEQKEGPYTPYWAIDLEADMGYSLALSKKMNINTGPSGIIPVSVGLRQNRLYRLALDSYLTISTLMSTYFESGGTSEGFWSALWNEINDKAMAGVANSKDIGLLVEYPELSLMFGAVIKDIGGTDIYQGEFIQGSTLPTPTDTVAGNIPQTLNMGVSYSKKVGVEEQNLMLAADVRDIGIPDQSAFLKLHFGGEYELKKHSVWVRAGVNQGYITYGISALAKLLIFRLYFEASKFEGEEWGSRLPGIHTTDPLYTYNLSFRLSTPLPLKMKIKAQEGKEDIYF